MIDTILALFILWILVLIIGLIRRGITWNFLTLFLLLVMFYEGADIVLVISLLFINVFSLALVLRGEEDEWD